MYRPAKSIILSLTAIHLAAFSTIHAEQATAKKVTPAPAPPEVLATVNGVEITRTDCSQRMAAVLLKQLGPRRRELSREQFAQLMQRIPKDQLIQVVSSLIDEQLLREAANKEGIEIAAAEVDKRLQSITPPQGMNLDTFLQAQGTTRANVKEDIREELAVRTLLTSKTSAQPLAATEKDVADFYQDNPTLFQTKESIRARHILIQSQTPELDAAAKQKIEEIRERLVGQGAEDFGEVAKVSSEGPSASSGGDLGQFGRGRMVPPFDKAAFELQEGEISEPVKTRFGWHLIKVEEKIEGGETRPLDAEMKAKISEVIENQREQDVINAYLDVLRTEAEIVRFPM